MRWIWAVPVVGWVALAHAGEPEKKITKAIAKEVVSGRRPLADLIDAGRGVVIVDGKKSQHLCGEDLNAVGEMLARASDELWGTEGLTCTNRPKPSCTLGRDDDSYRLDFSVDKSRGLILEAVVTPGDAKAPSGGTCAAAAPQKPTKVTKSLVRQIAWGLRPMSDVVDPARGVVRASSPNSGDENAKTPPAKHLCGKELDLEALRRSLVRAIIEGENAPAFECKNTPVRECVFSQMLDEYSNVHHLVFVDDADRGLVIESWIDLDEALSSDEFQKEERLWAKKLVDDARAKPCAPAD